MAVVQDLGDRQMQVAPCRKNKESPHPQPAVWPTQAPSAIPPTEAHPGFHGSTVQISGHLSRTRGSRKESPFSAAKGRQVCQCPEAAEEAGSQVRGLGQGTDSPVLRLQCLARPGPSCHLSAWPVAPGGEQDIHGPRSGRSACSPPTSASLCSHLQLLPTNDIPWV